jgi:hypothetical protein
VRCPNTLHMGDNINNFNYIVSFITVLYISMVKNSDKLYKEVESIYELIQERKYRILWGLLNIYSCDPIHKR